MVIKNSKRKKEREREARNIRFVKVDIDIFHSGASLSCHHILDVEE